MSAKIYTAIKLELLINLSKKQLFCIKNPTSLVESEAATEGGDICGGECD